MKRHMMTGFILAILALLVFVPAFSAFAEGVTEKTLAAKGPVQKINQYFSTQTLTYSDGTSISRDVITGPPTPPPGHELERAAVALPGPYVAAGTKTLTVPAYTWVFGCSAVSASMIAAYYDRAGFPNMYTGPTGGGVMPLVEDAGWGTWTDGAETYPNNPLIASHNGLDGRATRGSIDDYWISYLSETSDPYITGGWGQHTWGDAIGDYMKTSQSAYSNVDGSTTFYTYTSNPGPLTCAAMESYDISDLDGTYGRKLFYEARGYAVTSCYNQKTDNNGGAFTFAKYKAEINAKRPVFLNLAGHSIVGVGYDDSTNPATLYIHDTWDNSSHNMLWGGTYSGMELLSVSVVTLKGTIIGTPSVNAVAPSSGAIGLSVNINGKDFGPSQGDSTVTFNGIEAAVTSWANTHIKATVPVGATTGPVVVTTPMGSSAGTKTFTVKEPLINSVSPRERSRRGYHNHIGQILRAEPGHVHSDVQRNKGHCHLVVRLQNQGHRTRGRDDRPRNGNHLGGRLQHEDLHGKPVTACLIRSSLR